MDDTHIDYPVVYGESNLKYINTDIYGNFSLPGSIFLDAQNTPDFSDQYCMVFGHHMDNGAMFGDVLNFVNADYFNSHSTGTLYLRDRYYHVEIFVCVSTDGSDPIVYNMSAQRHEDIVGLLEHIRKRSVQSRNIGVTDNDKILAMSTCVTASTNGRVLIYGKLIEAGYQ